MFRAHLNQRTNLRYELNNTMGDLHRWFRALNHADLLEEYLSLSFDLEQSGVVVERVLSICLLIE